MPSSSSTTELLSSEKQDENSSSSYFSSIPSRYKLLFFITLLPFGSGYSYDIAGSIGSGPGATIQSRFNDHYCGAGGDKNTTAPPPSSSSLPCPDGPYFTHATNQALYFCYSGPNIALNILAGVLIDSYGLRRCSILFSIIGTLGTVLFLLGSHFINLPLLLFSRSVVGFGNEAVVVCMGGFIAKHWQAGKLTGMALAFGFSQLMQRVAGSLNFLLSPRLAQSYGLDYALLAAIIANIISFFGILVLLFFDVRWSEVSTVKNKEEATKKNNNNQTCCEKLTSCLPCSSSSGKSSSACSCSVCCSPNGLTPKFWSLMIAAVCTYDVAFPFVGTAKNMFESVLGLSAITASQSMSIYQVLLAIGQPLVGFMIDRFGRLSFVLLFSSCMSLLGVILGLNLKGAFDDGDDTLRTAGSIILCLIFAISFVCAAATTRASVPLVIGSPKVTARAFGVMGSLIAGTTSIMRIVSGVVLDSGDDADQGQNHLPRNASSSSASITSLPSPSAFENLFFVFLGISCVGIIAAIFLNCLDAGVLCFSNSQSELSRFILMQSAVSRKRRIEEQKKKKEQEEKEAQEQKAQGKDSSSSSPTFISTSKVIIQDGDDADSKKPNAESATNYTNCDEEHNNNNSSKRAIGLRSRPLTQNNNNYRKKTNSTLSRASQRQFFTGIISVDSIAGGATLVLPEETEGGEADNNNNSNSNNDDNEQQSTDGDGEGTSLLLQTTSSESRIQDDESNNNNYKTM